MMAPIAQLNMHIEIESAASAQEQGRALRPEPWAVGGDQYVGLEPVAVVLAHLAQAGGAHLLARLDQVDDVEAEAAAGPEHRVEGGEINRVLSLIVGGAAAIEAVAPPLQPPRGQALRPFRFEAAAHVAVPGA